jgi:hypothetical protein
MTEPWQFWWGGFAAGAVAMWVLHCLARPRPTFTSQAIQLSAPLKTIDQHSADFEAEQWAKIPGYRTDVACPDCGLPLFRYIRGVDSWSADPRDHLFCRRCRKDFYSRPPESR